MALLKQSTARNRVIFMADETDHISGLAALTLTITASKNGAAFASISPTVTDRGNGWYNLALTTSHTDTLGDLALHVTATGADPTDLVDEVLVDLPGAEFTTELPEDDLPAVNDPPTQAQVLRALWYLFMTQKLVDGSELHFLKDNHLDPAIKFSINANPPTDVERIPL